MALWTDLNPILPGLFGYMPFFCRLAAVLVAAPFALCLALDIIAYAIARTLHLSMSRLRVPRSPLSSTQPLVSTAPPSCDESDLADDDSPISSTLADLDDSRDDLGSQPSLDSQTQTQTSTHLSARSLDSGSHDPQLRRRQGPTVLGESNRQELYGSSRSSLSLASSRESFDKDRAGVSRESLGEKSGSGSVATGLALSLGEEPFPMIRDSTTAPRSGGAPTLAPSIKCSVHVDGIGNDAMVTPIDEGVR